MHVRVCLCILIYDRYWYCFYLIQYQWLLHLRLYEYWKLYYQIFINVYAKGYQLNIIVQMLPFNDQIIIWICFLNVFLTAFRISFNFSGVMSEMGRYPLTKILIAFPYMCSCVINFLYIKTYFSFTILKYSNEFME